MKVYTKTGDNGKTSTLSGQRLSKADPLIEACGAVDELACFLGFLINYLKKNDKKFFLSIEKDLYEIMSFLAGAKVKIFYLEKRVKLFEKKIDEIENKLPPLKNFILPSGEKTFSLFHIVRAICRRAERRVVALSVEKKDILIKYFNRLSDLLFVVARLYNKKVIFFNQL